MSSEGFLEQPSGFATRAIHHGQEPQKWNSCAVVSPISMSTIYIWEDPNKFKEFEYSRIGNQSRIILEQVLASLDDAKHGIAFSSGLGAVTVITKLLVAGDHLLSGDNLYGGTTRYFDEVASGSGVSTTYVDTTDLAKVASSIQKNTKMVWLETPTNPLLKVSDIRAVADIVHKANKDIIVVVDNTFLSSYFQRPLTLGADIAMYSLSKFMNGHTDVVMGAAMTNSDKLHERLRFLQMATGVVPSPFDCYLVNRGLKTLELRMQRHMSSGMKIARFLEKHPCVEKVNHPGLPSHPQHELSKRQCYGHSGMVSFLIKGGLKEATAFFKSLKVFTLAESLGGPESLAELPSTMTHATLPLKERIKQGITDSLIRISVGLEDADDLVKDLDQALNSTRQKAA